MEVFLSVRVCNNHLNKHSNIESFKTQHFGTRIGVSESLMLDLLTSIRFHGSVAGRYIQFSVRIKQNSEEFYESRDRLAGESQNSDPRLALFFRKTAETDSR